MVFEALAALFAGAAVALFALVVIQRPRVTPAAARIRDLAARPDQERKGLSWDEIRRHGPSTLPVLRDTILSSRWAKDVAVQLDQAGVKLRVGEYLLIRIGLGVAVFIVIALIGRSAPTLVLGLAAGGIASFLPAVWLKRAREQRLERIAKQLPEAVTMIANALRAGFAFQHGVTMVAEQMDPPIADEFLRMQVDLNVGSSVDEALQGLLERADSEAMNQLVTAVLIQRSSGGNLAEILDLVGEQLRERERLYGEVRTMTAQMRFSGVVMSIWPLLLLGIFCLINWEQTSLLFTRTLGLVLLAIGGTLQFIGYLTIRRILDVKL
ncbi:MAG TPA: type II secretion system F family protein [Dehalococcoidia bacterium]|nr:type II secretion system F family protein [Dehalococcoidia bacterium]